MTRCSIIIPAYNERHRIGRTLEALREYARRDGRPWQIIVADDGSTDGTAELVEAFDWGPIDAKVLISPVNRGKGDAVRRGMLAADGDLRLMFDADASTPIDQLERLLPHIERGCAVVIGSRYLPTSQLDPPQGPLRRFVGACFRWYRRRLLMAELRDTQCGFKLFTADAAEAIFPRQKITGFAFDVEVLALAKRLGYRIAEVGVVWRDSRPSRVHAFRDSIRMGWTTLVIWWRMRRLRL